MRALGRLGVVFGGVVFGGVAGCPAEEPSADPHGLGGDPVLCSATLAFTSPGDGTQIAGSAAGRVAYGAPGQVHVVEVGANCATTSTQSLAIDASDLRMAGDGSLLVTRERYLEMGGWWEHEGTRFYALPGGALVGGVQANLIADRIFDMDVDDAGTRWGRATMDSVDMTMQTGEVASLSLHNLAFGVQAPRFAPDGQHSVRGLPYPPYVPLPRRTEIYALGKRLAALAGGPVGFIDNAHILVNRYAEEGGDFTEAVIVDLAGEIVQTTALPELSDLFRVGTGEILARRLEDGRWAVFDPDGGEALWTAGDGAEVALAGTDHLIGIVDGRVDLVRWR